MCRSCCGHGENQSKGIHCALACSAPSTALFCSAGKLGKAAGWAGEVPSPSMALQALRRARPVLLDMQHRAASEVRGSGWIGAWCWHAVCALGSEACAMAFSQADAEAGHSPDALPPLPCPCRPTAAGGAAVPASLCRSGLWRHTLAGSIFRSCWQLWMQPWKSRWK